MTLLTVTQRIFLAALCVIPLGQAVSAPRPPNIVVLVADDWGYSDVGAFGSEIATPNIDGLARAGARFSNFHVTASCSPTRSMLLTGVDNHRNGVGSMPEGVRTNSGSLSCLRSLASQMLTVGCASPRCSAARVTLREL